VEALEGVVERIVVGAPRERVADFAVILGDRASIKAGGGTRQETVRLLTEGVREEWILIHDAARPFASKTLCRTVLEAALSAGAAGAFLEPVVPVGRVEGNFVKDAMPRETLAEFQSPQAFRRDLLERAYELAEAAGRTWQSTGQMVLAMGNKMARVQGEVSNIKVTTEWEWEIARKVVLPAIKSGKGRSAE
jgi:2-C-methyl-D-erythritol 4-phosphate cytidylyltransferase